MNSGRLMAVAEAVYNAAVRHYDGSKRQAQLTAIDIMTYAEGQSHTVFSSDRRHKRSLFPRHLKGYVIQLFNKLMPEVLVLCTVVLCWKVPG